MMTHPLSVLSIQSHVVYGHVGNSAAVFPLQRLGAEVWPLHTVQFSNHTGYSGFEGQVFGEGLIRSLVAGLKARGVLGRCDGVLTGYLGSVEIGAAVLDAVAEVRFHNPRAVWCCDPVMGDEGKGLFVAPELVAFFKEQALPRATILTPNLFELALLTDEDCRSMASLLRAFALVHRQGPDWVMLTSLGADNHPVGDEQARDFDLLLSAPEGLYRLRLPRLALSPNGAGDLIAALLLYHRLNECPAQEALSLAGSGVHAVLARMQSLGCAELPLIEMQDELALPEIIYQAGLL